MIGKTLSHFTITAKLGEGGMGEVYRAEDTKLGREVAIKVLPQEVASDPERLARFEREARVLASLNHPNIAAIHDLQEVDGQQLLVLELVEGLTLAERMAQGQIPFDEILAIGRQIAEAFEVAHEKGIIHRDLKPANVKLTPEGQIKVLDFGLAKAFEVDPISGPGNMVTQSPTLTAQMTGVGVLLGTAAYMSPEQARGQAADKRADIWAFGCVMFEMLTGRQTFDENTVSDTLAAVLKSEVEFGALPEETPERVRRLVHRCLEKDPKQRLRDIGEARVALDRQLAAPQTAPEETVAVAAGRASAASPAPSRVAWLAAAVALLAATALAFLAWRLAQREERVVRAYVPAPAGTEFHLAAGAPGPVAVSPDGNLLVFSARDREGDVHLWVRGLDDLEARPLAGTENAAYPFWSPDSRWVAFFSDNKLRKIDVTGGPPMSLCDAFNGKGGSWSEAGDIIFAPSHDTPIHRVSSAGGEATPITELDAERGDNSHRHPRFLPDGQRFLYLARVVGGGGSEENQLVTASLAGDQDRTLMPSVSQAEYASGHLLFVREGTLMAQPFDPGKAEFTAEAFPVAEDLAIRPGAAVAVFSVSRRGVLAYQMGSASVGSSLRWFDRSGTPAGQLGEQDLYDEVHLSPDGRSAAVSIFDEEGGNGEIWIWDIERNIRTRFTFNPGNDSAIAWSPSGDRLAFSSTREEGFDDIYVKPVAGSGEAERVWQDKFALYPTSWSPDGAHIAYILFDQAQLDVLAIEVRDAEAPTEIQATEFFEAYPVYSHDGRWVAFVSAESGRGEIYVTRFPQGGRKWQVSLKGGTMPRWRSDDSELYFVSDNYLMAARIEIVQDNIVVGEVEQLFEIPAVNAGYDYDVTADGQRFLVNLAAAPEQQAPMTLVVNWTEDLPDR